MRRLLRLFRRDRHAPYVNPWVALMEAQRRAAAPYRVDGVQRARDEIETWSAA